MFGFFKRWFSPKVQKQKCPGWKMVPATEVMDDGVHHHVHRKAPCTAMVTLDRQRELELQRVRLLW